MIDVNAIAKAKMDINPAYPGLTIDLMLDIYSAHKAMYFGRFQRVEYSLSEFIDDIKRADRNVFGEVIYSQSADKIKKDPRFVVSFYPLYLANDDVFEVMACHFAVSLVVNRMVADSENVGGLYIRSVVIPAAITSRYDRNDFCRDNIGDLERYLRTLSPTTPQIRCQLKSTPSNIPKMASIIQSGITAVSQTRNGSVKHLLIVFDRRKVDESDSEHVCVVHCDDTSRLNELDKNYWISFEFRISGDEEERAIHDDDDDGDVPGDDAISPTERTVRCWMTFGKGQRLRFYPEYVVWIIPHLFVRPSTASYKVVDALYGDDYKHGWCVSLEDSVFNKYYHILTRHKHISNNYNRKEVTLHKDYDIIGVDCGLRDQLYRSWNVNLREFIEKQHFDSDTIVLDMVGDNGMISIDDSNIVQLIAQNDDL